MSRERKSNREWESPEGKTETIKPVDSACPQWNFVSELVLSLQPFSLWTHRRLPLMVSAPKRTNHLSTALIVGEQDIDKWNFDTWIYIQIVPKGLLI